VGNERSEPTAGQPVPLDRVSPGLQALSTEIVSDLEDLNIPSYVIDASGVVRWVNPAGTALVGDVRGRQFASVVVPEDARRAREAFARKLMQTSWVADDAVIELTDSDGKPVRYEFSSVPLGQGHRVIGVFGQVRPDARLPRHAGRRLRRRRA
jgi:PAS domain S-box-containing protein